MEKNVVITGANRGIGLALCEAFSHQGYRVIATCRKASPELRALQGVQIEEGIDVRDENCLESLKKRIHGTAIDVLINNAGTGSEATLETVTVQEMLEHFNIHVIGALNVTKTFLDRLKEGSKIIMISSRLGSLELSKSGTGPWPGGNYPYRVAKTALNALGVNLSVDLKTKGIAVAMITPGYVKTDMTQGKGSFTAEEAAKNILQVIEEKLNLDNSGSFFGADTGAIIPF